jgi:hypothetical protein
MPKFKKNPNPIMKKQGYGEGKSPFTMRSGNTTPFKQMGSSPLKQHYPSSAQKGSYGPTGTLDEVKRIAGEKATKVTKAANAKKYGMESLNKAINVRAKNPVTPKKPIGWKGILKGAGKMASRFLGPVGWGLTAAEVVETAPKVAKATIEGLKKKAKSGNVNTGRKL